MNKEENSGSGFMSPLWWEDEDVKLPFTPFRDRLR